MLIITTTLALSLFVQPGSATIVIDAALPDVPSEMYVLEAQSKAISSEQATYIASAIFNVTGEPTLANGSWTIKKNRLEVSIYETGSITFFDIAKMWDAGYTLAKPLPETEYKVIVEQLLEKLPAQGISTGNLQISYNDIVGDTSVTAFRNGTMITELNNVHVNFALSYNNTSVRGSGDTVRVYFGEEGRMIGFIGNFWQVEAVQKQKIITPAEAIEKLREIGYGMSMSKDLVSTAIVKSIELVYLAPAPEASNPRLVPFYYISGELTGKDGGRGELLQMVPAVG